MHTKLTLRIEAPLIKAAKKYSKNHGKSLSQLISDYLFVITETSTFPEKKEPSAPPPLTLSLKGILKRKKVHLKDYKKYLEEKYL